MIRLINNLGAVLHLPISVSWQEVPLSWNVPYERLTIDGAALAGPSTLEPRNFVLRGSIYFYAKAQIRAYHDNMLEFLRHTPIQVYQHHMDTRFLWAVPTGNPQKWVDGREELQIQLQMTAHDPYWYGPEVSDIKASTAWQLLVDGTAPTYPNVSLSFNGASSGLVLSNVTTGQAIDLHGAFEAGDVVTVDTARFAVRINGIEAMDCAGEEWLAGGYALVPGVNDLSLTGAGTSVTTSHTWRPRWF